MKEKKKLTTSFGSPVDDDRNSITVGPKGPVLIQDVHFFEKLAHFNRERIPERIVHAKGAARVLFYKVHTDYGTRIAEGLELNIADIKRLAS